MSDSSKSETSLGTLFLGSAIGGALAYFPLGPQPLTWALLGMIGLTTILGAFKQVKRGRGLWTNIAIGALGGGSVYLAAVGFGQYILVARLLAFLLFAFVGLSALGALLKVLFALGGMAMMVFIAIYVFKQSQNNQLNTNQVEEVPVVENTDRQKKSTKQLNAQEVEDVLISHAREWQDYKRKVYEGELEIWKSNVAASERNKSNLNLRGIKDAQTYWRKIYISFIENDTDYMDRVLVLFLQLAEKKNLDEATLVRTIVACVQDIPYSLVYRGDCQRIGEEQPALAALAQRVPCQSNVEFGLQTPASFLSTLKGDCDTRTVFLYTILDKIGYKVAILNSDIHGHSMLGVAIPSVGKYKSHQGRKYYFWETTAQGWKPGILPPDMGTPKDWYVVVNNG